MSLSKRDTSDRIFTAKNLKGSNFLRSRIIATVKLWAPYLIAFSIYFIWRGFIYEAPAGRNAPIELLTILKNPATFLAIVSTGIPDIVLILISSWYKILEPAALDFSVSINRNAFLIGIVSFFIFLYYLFRLDNSQKDSTPTSTREMFLVGLLALLLGLLPTYAGGYVIHTKLAPWNSRFSLGSLFGAALIITALIDAVVKTSRTRWIVIATLLSLLVGWHLRSENDFRWGWEKQFDFYRQFYLRAPSLEPGTAILSEEEFLVFMGNYSTSYGINLIYRTEEQRSESAPRKANYWLFTYADFSAQSGNYLNGKPFSIGFDSEAPRAGITFQGEPGGTLVISFEPELGQCLWVIRPKYASLKTLSPVEQQLASISHPERIELAPENPDSFLLKNLITNPEQDWCTYYEKADLASQYGDWEQVTQLWETAQQKGLGPENGFEYLPFLESFGQTGDWETAKRMTRSSQKTMQGIEPLLCDIWSGLENGTTASPEKEAAIASVREDLRCE